MCFILTLTIWFAQRCIRLQSGRTVVKRPDPPPSAHVAPKRPPELSVSQTRRKGRSRVQARWRRRERQGRGARRRVAGPVLCSSDPWPRPPGPSHLLLGPLFRCPLALSSVPRAAVRPGPAAGHVSRPPGPLRPARAARTPSSPTVWPPVTYMIRQTLSRRGWRPGCPGKRVLVPEFQ